MKKFTTKLAAVMAFGAAAFLTNQAVANTVTWTFQESGSNGAGPLGTTHTSWGFVESGYTVNAYGYLDGSPNTASALYAKYTSGDPSETGLGMVDDANHEINTTHFVQLDSHITPSGTLSSVGLSSIQLHEAAAIYGSNTLGTLGSTLLGSLNSDGTLTVSSTWLSYRYFGVTDVGSSGGKNVLIASVSANVPDGGTTGILLGLGLLGAGFLARRLKA